MNKIIIIIIVLAVIAGGAWYYTKNKSGNEVKNQSNQAQEQPQEKTVEASLKSLIDEGKDVQCTFNIAAQDNAGAGTGTFYVSKGKSRGDIQATTAGAVSTSHIISDNSTAYFWIDGSDLAYKIKIDEAAKASSSSQAPIDTNTKYKVDCNPWTVDQSKFTLPNIEFKEFIMPTVPTATSDIKNMSPSDICNSLPAGAKQQCLASIKK